MISVKKFTDKTNDFIAYIEIEKNLSPHTQKAYQGDLDQFIEFWEKINKRDKSDIAVNRAFERFLVYMYNQNINKNSIARKVSCFKSFEKFLQSVGIKINLSIARPKTSRRLPIYLTVDEVFQLLDKTDNEDLPTKKPLRDKAVLEILYATGVRCSELVQIKFKDINLDDKIIRIIGKGNRERMVLFGDKAKERLLLYLENEREPAKSVSEYIFTNPRGTQLTTRSIQRIVEMFRKFLTIERPITPHKIRHSFATHMLNQGVALRVVQELLGHQSLASTEMYTHVTTTELAELCDKIHPIKKMLKKK